MLCSRANKDGHTFRSWVSLLYKNPRAAVMTNGMTSSFFTVSRGTRQGCPLSPLLFTIVLEPLAIMIRANSNIMGVRGVEEGIEHKLMLYADDILLLSRDPLKSLPPLMSTIQLYSNVSGYKINWDKSEAMPISRTCYSHTVTQFGFKWIPKGMKYLGVKLTQNVEDIMLLNYEPLLSKIKNNVDKWEQLKLSLWGKVNIVKMIIAPQFNYISMMIPVNIPDPIFKRYDKIIKDFLWEGKRPRIKMTKLTSPRDKGGLGLPDVRMYNIAFEMAKLAKHWGETDSELDWIKIEQKLASPFHPISILSQCSGAKWDSNPVTIHSRHVWGKIHKGCRTSHYKQSYASLWNNPEIRIGKVGVFWKQWQLKGVNVIGDLYENGLFMSYSELVKKYNIGGQGNFWKYLQIRHCVKNKFNASNNPVYAYLELPRVAQSASMCYKSMLSVTADTCNNLKTIWQKDLGININDDDWRYIISNVGKNIREVRGKFIQYKIIHRYYCTI